MFRLQHLCYSGWFFFPSSCLQYKLMGIVHIRYCKCLFLCLDCWPSNFSPLSIGSMMLFLLWISIFMSFLCNLAWKMGILGSSKGSNNQELWNLSGKEMMLTQMQAFVLLSTSKIIAHTGTCCFWPGRVINLAHREYLGVTNAVNLWSQSISGSHTLNF